MKSLVIIQARMGSNRLPGKTMKEIAGKPMLGYLVDTLKTAVLEEFIWVATSIKDENDSIRAFCNKEDIHCLSGSELDVASRYEEILKLVPDAEYFFRICGDTPYYGVELIKIGLNWIQNSEYDFHTSMPNKGYPMGCNLELFQSEFYLQHLNKFKSASNKEHVTSYFYENIDCFNANLVACDIEGYNYPDYKFSVDTEQDFEIAKQMLKKMKFQPWNYSILQKLKLQQSLKLKED
jgi:spore coat polysaccharide biosynthesis protein SpsF